jgi:L-malate glycosyltransferase
MNILFITNHLNIGGITSYCLTLSSTLKISGHNVYIASSGGDLTQEFIDKGIIFIPLSIRTKQELSPKIFMSALKLCSVIDKYAINIVHTNSRTTQVLGCLLQRLKGVTHVSTCHGFFKPRLFRKIFPCWGSRVIAISDQVKQHLIHDLKVKSDKIDVIHNGIDIEKFKTQSIKHKEELKVRLNLGGALVIGIVARLSDVKGHIYLLEAMQNVLKVNPKAQLLIVGEGKMKQELINLANSLKIENNVKFISSVNNTKDVLDAMDIFVMPSLKEGLGLALIEAMASGLAVIGSDIGGIKTLIKNEYSGLLVAPKDTNGLSKAISDLLADSGKRKALGINAQAFISQNFSQEKMAKETLETYLRCVK